MAQIGNFGNVGNNCDPIVATQSATKGRGKNNDNVKKSFFFIALIRETPDSTSFSFERRDVAIIIRHESRYPSLYPPYKGNP